MVFFPANGSKDKTAYFILRVLQIADETDYNQNGKYKRAGGQDHDEPDSFCIIGTFARIKQVDIVIRVVKLA
jgi:hypothetical protein